MHKKNTRLFVSFWLCIAFIGIVFLINNITGTGGKFTQSSALTPDLQSTVCSTDDANNDIGIKGTVKLQNGSPDSVDSCEGDILTQTQCTNKQNAGTIQTSCPNGCSEGICMNTAADTLKWFTITMADEVAVNTATGITVTAIKNDNSVDTTYNSQISILIEGDRNASFPLATQTLVNGVLTLDQSINFTKTGSVTVIVKDNKTGTKSSKNLVVIGG